MKNVTLGDCVVNGGRYSGGVVTYNAAKGFIFRSREGITIIINSVIVAGEPVLRVYGDYMTQGSTFYNLKKECF